jgi:hypothetical protein
VCASYPEYKVTAKTCKSGVSSLGGLTRGKVAGFAATSVTETLGAAARPHLSGFRLPDPVAGQGDDEPGRPAHAKLARSPLLRGRTVLCAGQSVSMCRAAQGSFPDTADWRNMGRCLVSG